MKAFVLKSHADIGYMEKPYPTLLKPHGAILRPLFASPCTSDVHTIWQGSPKQPNLTLGHECVAEIVSVGADVVDFKPGDVVIVSAITPDWSQPDVMENPAHAGRNFSGHMLGKSIDGAMAEAFYLPYVDKNVAHMPTAMDPDDALMCADVMQTGLTAVEEADVQPGDTVVVMGIGAIGLASIMAAKAAGASRIFAIGSSEHNASIARSLSGVSCQIEVLNYKTLHCTLPAGLHPLANSTGSAVVNYVLQETGTKGADKVIICGGSDLSLAQAVDMVKYGTGVVSNVMYFGADPDLQAEEQEALARLRKETSGMQLNQTIDGLVIPKFGIGRGMAGKTLKFSLSRGGRPHLEKTIRLVQEQNLHPGMFVTEHLHGLDQIEQSVYDMKNRKAIKISVDLR